MYDALRKAICDDLPATGSEGFEGFVRELIQLLCGPSVLFLSKAGAQRGRDASTAGYGGETYLDVECKQYGIGRSPRSRDLIGGLSQAINASREQLDLWIVVSTSAIGSADAEELRQVGNRDAVAVEVIDWQETELPQLAVLCAAFASTTLAVLEGDTAGASQGQIARDLQTIAGHHRFDERLATLKRRLSSADLGLDHARTVANAWVEARLQSKKLAVSSFNQPLCVDDPGFQPYVDRPLPQMALNSWYFAWNTTPSIAVTLGLEGSGKSWVTLAWWRRLVPKPLTLLITSNREIRGSLDSILASALTLQTAVRSPEFWLRRLRSWLRRPPSATPMVLLILDGLNERSAGIWDQLFASLAEPQWAGRLAVVTTCRPAFWSEYVSPFLPDDLKVTPVDVGQFSDDELAHAWADRDPGLVSMPGAVRDLIRNARIFRLARTQIEHLTVSGDLTVTRLLMEDWMDRRRLRLGLAHTRVEFNDLIIELGRQFRAGALEFGRRELRGYSRVAERAAGNLERDLDEIIAGHLFEEVDPPSGRYRIRTEHIGLALGMLLAREVRDARRETGVAGVESVLAETIEPIRDFDQANALLCGACAVASLEGGYPRDARVRLFSAWLRLPNLDDLNPYDFVAYLPLDPESFFDLAEEMWRRDDATAGAREWLEQAILRWREIPTVQALIESRCRRWLGLWHVQWRPYSGGKEAEEAVRQERVMSAVSQLAAPSSRLPRELLRPAASADEPFISRLALLLISSGARVPHATSLIAWGLSRAVMGFPYEIDEVAWCLRLNDIDPSETEAALIGLIEALVADGSELGLRAARDLLWACGTPAAASRRAALPAPEEPIWRWRGQRMNETDPLDPDAVVPADVTSTIEQLTTLTPDVLWRSFGITAEDHQLEACEPVLAHFAPHQLGDFYRGLLRAAAMRQGMRLRQLGWQVPQLLMLIGPQEAEALDSARRSLLSVLDADTLDACATEAYLLIGVLACRTAEEQIDLIVSRPRAASDLLLLERVFVAVGGEVANSRVVEAAREDSGVSLRRIMWILGHQSVVLTNDAREVVVGCFGHSESGVRAMAFRLVASIGDRAALRRHSASKWRVRGDAATEEAFYGSLALIDGAEPVDYVSLRDRVTPDLLGYLAIKDGSGSALDAFAEDLAALWRVMSQSETESAGLTLPDLAVSRSIDTMAKEQQLMDVEPLPESNLRTMRVSRRRPTRSQVERFFDSQTLAGITAERREFNEDIKTAISNARKAGRWLFGIPMRVYGLREVVAARGDLVEEWVRALDHTEEAAWDVGEFYRSICVALATVDPPRAARIASRLRDVPATVETRYLPLNVESATWLTLSLPPNPSMDGIRDRVLSEAYTDDLLFEIALGAQATGRSEWLRQTIARGLLSKSLFRNGRSLTLIGALDEGAMLDSFRSDLDGRSGFLADVAMWARARLQQNQRARHWFSEFATRRDPVEAWAAFRLFLHCVDRRFYLWRDAILRTAPDVRPKWRLQVDVSDHEIRQRASKNEGRLTDTLFGQRIARNEMLPWFRVGAAGRPS